METNTTPCPLCGKPIQTWDIDWKCPACGTLNKNWNHMSNCEWCRFAPHFLNCPHCKDDFDLSLLMFRYVDDSGKPIHESGRRKNRPAVHRHRLGDLNSSIIGNPEKNAVEFLTDEFLELLANFEFHFPDRVGCFVVHTMFVSPDDRLWQHIWLYKNSTPDENEQPLGQLSIIYPGKSGESERDNKKITCVLLENFW